MRDAVEINDVLRRLWEYAAPEVFLTTLGPAKKIPNERFFNDPHLKPLMEAWAAGQFASALERNGDHVHVRLEEGEHQFPDFRVCVDGCEFEFELKSVDTPGRRRGLECKKRAADQFLMRPYRPAQGEQEGPEWIAGAVRHKAKKRYAAKPHLLVYANFDANRLDLRRCLDLCQQDCDCFRSVWLLWAMRIGKIHDEGHFREAPLDWFNCAGRGN